MGRPHHRISVRHGTCALIVDNKKHRLCHVRKKYYILLECSTDGHFSEIILKPFTVLGFSGMKGRLRSFRHYHFSL